MRAAVVKAERPPETKTNSGGRKPYKGKAVAGRTVYRKKTGKGKTAGGLRMGHK